MSLYLADEQERLGETPDLGQEIRCRNDPGDGLVSRPHQHVFVFQNCAHGFE